MMDWEQPVIINLNDDIWSECEGLCGGGSSPEVVNCLLGSDAVCVAGSSA